MDLKAPSPVPDSHTKSLWALSVYLKGEFMRVISVNLNILGIPELIFGNALVRRQIMQERRVFAPIV